MNSKLDAYINKYLQDAGATDKKVARHLKEIIPKTTHLDENIFKQIIEELKRGMNNGKDFKSAFLEICEKYILSGDVIKAELPFILTRIILNEHNFLMEIARNLSVAPGLEESLELIVKPADIINAVESKDQQAVVQIFGESKLHNRREVVFAAFDEDKPASDPFLNNNIEEIINRLALEKNVFKENECLTAVSIRYKNEDNILKRFPAFTDAGWYDKFYPSENHDNYGRTKPQDESFGSVPEIVHENLRLADVIDEIRFLEE